MRLLCALSPPFPMLRIFKHCGLFSPAKGPFWELIAHHKAFL